MLTTLIIGAFLFGALGGDGCIQDLKATMLDMTPEEQETNIGKNFKATTFWVFSFAFVHRIRRYWTNAINNAL